MDSSVYRKVDLAAGIVFVDVDNFLRMIQRDATAITYYFDGKKYQVPLHKSRIRTSPNTFVKGIGSHIESIQNSTALQKRLRSMLTKQNVTYIMLIIEGPAINKKKSTYFSSLSSQMAFDFSLPGGSKHAQETPHQCIEREFLEETGFYVNSSNSKKVYRNIPYYFMGNNASAVSTYYLLNLQPV